MPGLQPTGWPGPVMYYPVLADGSDLQALAPGATVTFVDGKDPAAAAARGARGATSRIVFAQPMDRANRSTSSLTLDGNQDALIDAVAAANPSTVGRPRNRRPAC